MLLAPGSAAAATIARDNGCDDADSTAAAMGRASSTTKWVATTRGLFSVSVPVLSKATV